MQRWTATRERYDPERGDEYVFCELDESDDGDYVRFDDASAEIARLRKAILWTLDHMLWDGGTLPDGFDPSQVGGDDEWIATLCRLAEGE